MWTVADRKADLSLLDEAIFINGTSSGQQSEMRRGSKRARLDTGQARLQDNELVPCPVCGRQTPLLLVNQHLDTICSGGVQLPGPAVQPASLSRPRLAQMSNEVAAECTQPISGSLSHQEDSVRDFAERPSSSLNSGAIITGLAKSPARERESCGTTSLRAVAEIASQCHTLEATPELLRPGGSASDAADTLTA